MLHFMSLKYLLAQIVDIYKIDDRTPLLLLLYRSFDISNPFPGVNWAKEQMSKNDDMQETDAPELTQKLTLLILDSNAKRLPANLTVERLNFEKDFKLSFLLPLGPLTPHDIGKLNLNTGCLVCGRDISSRCSQCQSVSYCGSGTSGP